MVGLNFFMKKYLKQITILSILIFAIALSSSTRASDLSQVSDTMSSHNASKTSVTHTIKFTPVSNISGPGDLKITFANEFDLTNVIASAYVTVSGGGVTWDSVVNGDLVGQVLTLGYSSGTLTSGSPVTVTITFTKNPSSTGNYDITVGVGADNFIEATDSRTITTVITNGDVGVSANVPYPETNPTITNLVPTPTIVISSGATQIITFDLTDVNNDNVDYTVTPSSGTISFAPTPATPATGTSSATTITFTYFANGTTGAQTVTLTADDAEATGGGIVTLVVDLFII